MRPASSRLGNPQRVSVACTLWLARIESGCGAPLTYSGISVDGLGSSQLPEHPCCFGQLMCWYGGPKTGWVAHVGLGAYGYHAQAIFACWNAASSRIPCLLSPRLLPA